VDREKLRENRKGSGERQSGGACKHCFQYLIPVYRLPVYPMIGQSLWQFSLSLTSIIWLRALSLTNTSSMWSPPTPRLLTLWHLTIRETVFSGGRGLRYLKRCLNTGSPLPLLFAHSVFHCSLPVFARLQTESLAQARQERRHRDYTGLLQPFFTLLLIGLTQVACFSKSQYTLTASLLHPSFGSIVYSPMIIKRDYTLWKQPWKHAFLK